MKQENSDFNFTNYDRVEAYISGITVIECIKTFSKLKKKYIDATNLYATYMNATKSSKLKKIESC
jgi:hypothetical protein